MTDHNEIESIQRKLVEMTDRLMVLSPKAADARQIVEYDGDRKKRVLALSMAPLLANMSSAAAEAQSRASDNYAKAMSGLGGEFKAAQQVLYEWEQLKLTIEVYRSLLAVERKKVEMM